MVVMLDRGDDQGGFPGGRGLSESGADLSGRALLDRGAVHVTGASRHRGSGEDVLDDRVLHEPLGSDHRDPAGVDVVLADDALDAAEVVDVGVGVDHRDHRARCRGAADRARTPPPRSPC